MRHTQLNIKNDEVITLLKKSSPVPGEDRLPQFNPDWLNREPRVTLSPDQIIISDKNTFFSVFSSAKLYYTAAAISASFATAIFLFNKPDSGPEDAIRVTRLSAVIAGIHGSVTSKNESSQGKVFFGNSYAEGTLLTTAKDSSAELSLYPGTIVRIRPESEILIKKAVMGKNGVPEYDIKLTKGQILSVVNKSAIKGVYTLNTPDASVTVKGTVFETQTGESGTKVIVAEGTVRILSTIHPGEPDEIKGGTELILAKDGQSEKKENRESVEKLNSELIQISKMEKEVASPMRRALSEAPEVSEERLSNEEFRKNLEIITLTDGRELYGMVISQSGDRLLLQTTSGKVFIYRSDILKIQYQSQ
jgi:hypothetical protein